jgi:hypothetical protein
MPVILATQEVEIRRIVVRSQLGQIVHETLSQKKTSSLKRAGGVVQGIGPESSPSTTNKQKNKYTPSNMSFPQSQCLSTGHHCLYPLRKVFSEPSSQPLYILKARGICLELKTINILFQMNK